MTLLVSEWPKPAYLLFYASASKDRRQMAQDSPGGPYYVYDEEAKNSRGIEDGLEWSEGLTAEQCLEFLEETSLSRNGHVAIATGKELTNDETLTGFIDSLRDMIAFDKTK